MKDQGGSDSVYVESASSGRSRKAHIVSTWRGSQGKFQEGSKRAYSERVSGKKFRKAQKNACLERARIGRTRKAHRAST